MAANPGNHCMLTGHAGAVIANIAIRLAADDDLPVCRQAVIAEDAPLRDHLFCQQQIDPLFVAHLQHHAVLQRDLIAGRQGYILKESRFFACGDPLLILGRNAQKPVLGVIRKAPKALRRLRQPQLAGIVCVRQKHQVQAVGTALRHIAFLL